MGFRTQKRKGSLTVWEQISTQFCDVTLLSSLLWLVCCLRSHPGDASTLRRPDGHRAHVMNPQLAQVFHQTLGRSALSFYAFPEPRGLTPTGRRPDHALKERWCRSPRPCLTKISPVFVRLSLVSVDMNQRKLWEIKGTEEPGMLQSMESQRVGYDLATEQ